MLLDPPRAGCMPGTLDALLDVPPERVVYVSCDPETLARDLAILTAGPFRIEQVRPVDMFPQTYHVEAVATLVRDDERLAVLRARESLVLASSSPRRTEILGRLGLPFETDEPGVDEPDAAPGADPVEVARERALEKARAVASRRNAGSVLGADTVVELDGVVLGKPRDEQDAARMLRDLRGREHRVITAVALVDAATGEAAEGYRASRVVMRDYADDEIAAYVASGAPMDKAGAYGVQDEAFAPASEVRGCYLNVVGLPVCETLKLAERFGLRLRPRLRFDESGTVARAGALPRVRGAGAPETPERTQQAMNILGIGNLELIWILLLALVLLGPGRMVDAARAAGKFWREAQHVLRAAADAATVSLDAPPPRSAPRDPLPEPEDAVARGGSGDEDEVHTGGGDVRDRPLPTRDAPTQRMLTGTGSPEAR